MSQSELLKLFYILIWNFVVFLLFGLDKYYAIKNKWRISEDILLTCAFLFGGVGAYLGMQQFRHKTKQPKFKVLIPLFALLSILFSYFIIMN